MTKTQETYENKAEVLWSEVLQGAVRDEQCASVVGLVVDDVHPK